MTVLCTPFFNVSDLQASIDWYRKVGFAKDSVVKGEDGKPAFATLTLGDAVLWLGDMKAAADDDPEFKAWVGTPLGAGVMLNYQVPDVDALWKKAGKAKAVVDMEIGDFPEGRMFSLNDPDGYVVGFWTAPKAKPKKAAKKRATRKTPKRKR